MKINKIEGTVSLRRSLDQGTEVQRKAVLNVIEHVKEAGDNALFTYTEKWDGAKLSTLKVSKAEIEQAYQDISPQIIPIIHEAAENIRNFHQKQVKQSWLSTKQDGTILGQQVTALDAVGVYVPGGKAAYPSSVLMNVIPAQVAGVERIAMVSPPASDGSLPTGVLVAADILGVEEIYKVGGAQAIAALAYGTETIKAVDKIVGPGNIFVALAKKEVYGMVDIDSIAGPSEIVVLADDTAKANEIAADLLSQAEHDERASSVLVTTSELLAEAVKVEVEKQLVDLPRESIARAALEEYGAIYITSSMKEALHVVNELAPEHLEVMTAEPMNLLPYIKHAGAIFLGRYSSEPIGDYFAGPNHVLPTNGTARFSSGLSVDEFIKKSSIVMYSEQALIDSVDKIAAFARLEGLEAHARAVESRFK
ncbi:histidinol dehydrogenase [Sutcliffiella rhizosphaerae]|uniref:Histidinol dehydrogenase n=1 Tax=Sutcliffiella rhizosphaerae TaxID=2880967 RepID=A0ABN8A9P2_9BACI|nr:histidinol dehydrogenase [Sutcliffiella rhizosphaerae]CAG9620702.1 Histidinol dehydrogenase [Sutcliffiella rhizosphaerae]